eukprot:Gb_17378 [translate_table: standard]
MGETLSDKIRDAISSASLHIAIFSKNYAESQWCLDELCLMLERGTKIIPVFYNVKPNDLRWVDAGAYADALKVHEKKKRSAPQTLQKWKNALHEVSYRSGFEFDSQIGDLGKLMKDIGDCVLKEVKRETLDVAKHPVGLNEAVEDFEKTNFEKNGNTKIVGIVGMGGVGKTTLAKEFYNRKHSEYSHSSFLFDVRDAAVKNTLESLQSKLLSDLCHFDRRIQSVSEGKEILRKRLRGLHALIILDDIDHDDQLDALLVKKGILGPSSLILITSRDEGVLKRSEIKCFYKVKGLNVKHAEELFCSHAFLQPHLRNGFEDLVKGFLTVCDGLPLSLKVFGGHLSGNNDKAYWKCELKKISRILPSDIKKKLKISYNALDREEQLIFMDIACFLLGEDKNMAIRIWDGSDCSGLVGLQTLQRKCLVELEDEKYLKMHDHLRDLGRDMAGEDPLTRRLWRPNDVKGLFNQLSQGTMEVRGIRTGSRILRDSSKYQAQSIGNNQCKHSKFHTSSLVRVTGLQLLVVEDDCVEIKLSKLCGDLLWLRWYNCPSKIIPSRLAMKNLRVLDLIDGRFEMLWHDDEQLPLQLRELNILSSLGKFPKTIGVLKHLEKIILNRSNNMKTLPEGFSCLESLKHLELISCTELESLPIHFGDLTNLQHLDLSDCSKLKMLPDSFSQLIKLQYLCLKGCCSLLISREVLGNISSLEDLNFARCKKLDVLPMQITCQTSLRNLSLLGTSLKELPNDIGKLRNLKVLEIESNFLTMLPPSLGNLSCLVMLSLQNCKSLQSIPECVGQLKHLETLTIFQSGVEYLPEGVAQLSNLEYLEIKHCPILQVMFTSMRNPPDDEYRDFKKPRLCINPKGMYHLKCLVLRCTRTSKISIQENICPNLEALTVSDCKNLVEVESLPTTLVRLKLENCWQLKRISGLSGLSKLRYLDISGCCELEEMSNLAYMISLEDVKSDGCWKLESLEGLQQLKLLKKIQIAAGNGYIWKDINFLQQLPSKISSLILSAKAVGVESELDSILNTIYIPVTKVHCSRTRQDNVDYFGFRVAVREAKSCTAIIMCFISKASSKCTLDVCIPSKLNSKCGSLSAYSVPIDTRGECLVMSIFTQDSRFLEEIKFHGNEEVLVRCEVKNGWMVMVKSGEEWKISEAVIPQVNHHN